MSDELNELQNITHQYRKSLEAYEARTGRAPQTVDTRGSGEEKEKFSRMDADLTAIELLAQNKALEARLAKLEAEPTLVSRAPSGRIEDSESYRNAWWDGVRRGSFSEMRAIMGLATNAGTGVTGATTVPTDFERRVIELLYNNSPIRSVATVSTIDSKRTIPIESSLPDAALVGENASITPDDPTFGTSIAVVPYKFVCATKMTQEFIEDAYGQGSVGSGIDYVARKVALSLSRSMNNYYETGSGSGQPQGIFGSGVTNTVDIGAGGSGNAWSDDITADLLLDAIHAVGPQYRQSPRFRWMMSDSCLKAVRKLKANNEYIFTMAPDRAQSATSAAPGMIWGVPYLISEHSAAATTFTDGTIYAVVGDFQYFEIFDRTGITTFIDPYSSASTHCTTLYTYARTDSHVMNGAAFAKITA